MKKTALCAAAGLLALSSTSALAEEIAIALHVEPNNLMFQVAERMKEEIESRSDGRFDVVLLGLEVGGERDQIEATSAGEYNIVLGGSVPMSVYAPGYAAADLPFVWNSSDQAAAVYEGERGERIQAELAENGNLHLLGLTIRNPRNLTSNRPVASPADLQGARIRVPQIPAWVEVWSELGALPSPIAWPEVYTSLQTGVIEMQENPVENIQSGKLYEVQTHVNLTEHVYSFFHWLANDEWFEALSAGDQALIQDAADTAFAWGDEQTTDGQARISEELKAEGMTFVDADTAAFRALAEPAIRRIAANLAPEVGDYVLSKLD